MNNFIWAVVASLLVSAVSLVGIFSFLLSKNSLEKILLLLVGFSAGGLIGGAFLHLLPEALEQAKEESVFILVVAGFIFFFILEKYLHWRHCHQEDCAIHVFTYLNLIGDGMHNFTDGLLIATSFYLSVHFGIITSLIIILHEIPQEIGDFAVLVYGGFSRSRALFCNFVVALICVLGVLAGYLLAERMNNFSSLLLPLVAGGFIYIAGCDLIPELHRHPDLKRGTLSIVAFICGIALIVLGKRIFGH